MAPILTSPEVQAKQKPVHLQSHSLRLLVILHGTVGISTQHAGRTLAMQGPDELLTINIYKNNNNNNSNNY